ncbi:MAG: histidinol-phosphatase, partial [bacterium]
EFGIPAAEYTRRVVETGGWAVIAHPDERRHKLPDFPPYPWTAWEANSFQALEIWNQMSEWMERLNRWNKLWLYINPRRSVVAPTSWTLNLWDQLNLKRRVVGIGGVDAHAFHYSVWRNIKVEVFPYKVQFRSILTHLLLPEPLDRNDIQKALNQIFAALRSGRAFISNRYVGEARGFHFAARDIGSGRVVQMGDRLPPGTRLEFTLKLPPDVDRGVLLKDSQPVWKGRSGGKIYETGDPGVYRIEAFKKHRAFIFSNPIVIEAA